VPTDSLAERLNGKLYQLFTALVLAYVVVSGFAPMLNQVDLGFQVAQGRWMVQHEAAYRHDVFNYPNLDHPVINEYSLFEIVLYAACSLGWWGPCLLTSAAYAVLIVVLIRAAKSFQLEGSVLFAVTLGLMLLFFQVAFPLRPHLVTYLAVSVLGVFLLRNKDATSWTIFWPMALLQVAWVNSHSAFILGPIMVGLFGAEITARRWLREKALPWSTVRTWLGAFLLILLACLINPHGWMRFYPVFFQADLESIRAYVGEMEPLGGGLATIYETLTVIAVITVLLGIFRRNGAIALSFVLIAILLFVQAQSVNKAWPFFGLFPPLLVLSSGAFATSSPRPGSFPAMLGMFFVAIFAAMALEVRLDSQWDSSLHRQWQEYDNGRSELPLEATTWMKAHGITGRLFHRCEDGGWLQMSGYDQGQTYADTGFGKYDEAFVHEVGLVNERPALVPKFLAAYLPDVVVCNTFCYQWPFYLEQANWRLVFYSPNSSVWVSPTKHLDLPTASDNDVEAAFDQDIAANGIPSDIRLFGRNLIALNSLGLGDYAFEKLTSLPPEMHRTPWYWEAARIMCFNDPPLSSIHRDALEAEATSLGADATTAEFRAWYLATTKDNEGALHIFEAIPANKLSNYDAELLLRIYLERNRPEALALARRTDCFDLRNGRHWEYLAQAEAQAGNIEAARAAWRKAVFYYPDDDSLMSAAANFAATQHDDVLTQAIADSSKVYGAR
jgi:hypothetical protein